MIRLYGHQKGESSFVQVTRGLRCAANAAGLLAGEVALDLPDDERAQPGAEALIGLHCGAPLGVRVGHQTGMHRQHWLLLAPNSYGIPPHLRMGLSQNVERVTEDGALVGVASMPLVNGFLAPSQWAVNVLCDQFPEHMVRLAQHGVHPEVHCPHREDYTARVAEYGDGEFRVAHFTSSLGQRKGTLELLAAWRDLIASGKLPKSARLLIVSNPLGVNEYLWRSHEIGVDPQTMDVIPNPEASQSSLAAALRHAHLVCQPSRAEGFGLVPLEARACGVPVAMTTCTGHSEHWSSAGAVAIRHGELAPMDDYPGAMAPTVTVDAVRDALEESYSRWLDLAAEAIETADKVREEWSWEKRNAAVLRELVDCAG